MLVLTLRDHEAVRIGEAVVWPQGVVRNSIRLVIDAPRSVTIERIDRSAVEPPRCSECRHEVPASHLGRCPRCRRTALCPDCLRDSHACAPA